MNTRTRWIGTMAVVAVVVFAAPWPDSSAFAQRGGRMGGGARMGGGGFRPSLGGGMGMGSRMGMARPGMGGMNMGGMGMARPGMGGVRMGGGSGMGGIGMGRPGVGGMNMGGMGMGRPGMGGMNLSGSRPGLSSGRLGTNVLDLNRRGAGGPAGVRSGLGVGNRVGSIGSNLNPLARPGLGVRPGLGNRSIIGSGSRTNLINNRQNWTSNRTNTNIIGNTVNINRAGWGWGGGRGWGVGRGWGSPGWGGAWMNTRIPYVHRGWYHGAWAGNWYAPMTWGGGAWGLANSGYGYGYGSSFVNPYYEATPNVVYNYSQPIVLQTVADAGAADQEAADDELTPEQQQGYNLFDQARTAFASNDYAQAQDLVEQALSLVTDDPVLHEFHALCSFALGDYRSAAAVLESLLAVAPGWDWTTMSSLYGSTTTYTDQLRTLEDFCREHPDDPAAHFVLAYHYLVLGHQDSAVRALKVVTELQPNDSVASRLLQALTESSADPDSPSTPPADPPPAAPEADTAPADTAPADDGPTTDITGQWQAKPDEQVSFALTINDDGTYSWVVTPKDQSPTTIEGSYELDGDVLILQNEEQGDFSGETISEGPDRFTFRPVGAPSTEPGLTFDRVPASSP